MSEFWSVGLALLGVLCIALCGYYTGMCYFDKMKWLSELAEKKGSTAAPPSCPNGGYWAFGFGASGLLCIGGALYNLWPSSSRRRRSNVQAAAGPNLQELRARYEAAGKARPNLAATAYGKAIRAANGK